MTSNLSSSIALPAAAAAARRPSADAPVRYSLWIAFAVLLAVAPLAWQSSLAQTLLSQVGVAIIACLAYNILLGQGGMLSFGHAVYSGLGAYLAIHTLNAVGAGTLALPVSLVPLVGGLAGLFFAALFGYVTTRKSGTTFAMITLGIGELVWSMSLMLPEFFGGEGGIVGNRVVGTPVVGISFGPQIEVYYLIAVYCFVCTAAMYALTRTPLGRMLNAVHDNPERVEFIGYSTRQVRYLAFMISGFFMGIAGGLGALDFEIVTAEVLGLGRSGAYLLFVFLGGTGAFHGPIIGAVLMVLALVLLSELTSAWLLYLGLIFVLMVMFVPGGIASFIEAQRRVDWRAQWRSQLARLASALPVAAGAAVLIEMTYHRQLNAALDPRLTILGVQLDTSAALHWLGAGALLAAGLLALHFARKERA
jgi:branched-chain amino acid transport system permease protein